MDVFDLHVGDANSSQPTIGIVITAYCAGNHIAYQLCVAPSGLEWEDRLDPETYSGDLRVVDYLVEKFSSFLGGRVIPLKRVYYA